MKPKFTPKEIFKQILEWSVIPTFDLVIDYGNQGVIFMKRKIAPYKNQWALPGLRMYKGENIEDTMTRISKQELGLIINPEKRIFLGQFVGKVKTEHYRQDLSTGYYLYIPDKQKITLNSEHFSAYKTSNKTPKPLGAMYKFYFQSYQKIKQPFC